MPELPELEALAHFLDDRTRGLAVSRVELASFSALKTVAPEPKELLGRRVRGWRRRGKYLCLELDSDWLVTHLSRGGWVGWHERVPEPRLRPGPGPLALRLGFSDREGGPAACGLDLTEQGTEKRLAVWIVGDPAEIDRVAELGPEPLDSGVDAARLRRALAGATLKGALTDQSRLAGVGNAYSDEVLHRARLSPFARAERLSEAEALRLWGALREVLEEALEADLGLSPSELKARKRKELHVHGRTGAPCPACGGTIREVAYSQRSLQYCPNCQTGGRTLADRRLSRLLK